MKSKILAKFARRKRNPYQEPKILWVCHGRKQIPKNWKLPQNIWTLDNDKNSDPDILVDLNFSFYKFISIPSVKKHLFSFDEIHEQYCPDKIFIQDINGEPIAKREFFLKMWFLLKNSKLSKLILPGWIISSFPDRNLDIPMISPDPIKFLSSISDLFKIEGYQDYDSLIKWFTQTDRDETIQTRSKFGSWPFHRNLVLQKIPKNKL